MSFLSLFRVLFQILRIFWFCAIFLPLAGFAGAQAPAFPAGRTTDLAWPQLADPIRVYVPDGYEATGTKAWPTVFYYHGTNGRPDTRYIRQFTNDDFIVVGMAYRERGLLVLKSPAHMVERAKEMTDRLESVLKHLGKHLRIDRKRLACAGVSKGGWTVSLISNTRPGAFAGLAIVIGGRQKYINEPVQAKLFADKQVYIGVGETDNNYVYSRLADSFYRRHKAKVVFDTYWGLGHAIPPEIPVLGRWFTMLGAYHNGGDNDDEKKAQVEADAEAWLTNRLLTIKATEDPDEIFRLLQVTATDPFLPATPPELQQALRGQWQKLITDHPGFRNVRQSEKEFDVLIEKEMKIASLAQMKYVRDGYGNLLRKPLTKSTKALVQNAFNRCDEAYKDSLQATRDAYESFKRANPSTAPTRPTNPTNPLRRLDPPRFN